MPEEVSFIICDFCNKKNRSAAKFCKGCGKLISGEDKEEFITCPRCEKYIIKNARFCSKCGFKVSRIYEKGFPLPSAPETVKVKKIKRLNLEDPSAIQDLYFFFSTLEENYGMSMEELQGLMNYQKHLFEKNEKGLALIHKRTGLISSVNSSFEKFTGFPREILIGKDFITVLSEINKYNKKHDMNSILKEEEFYILNGDFEKCSLKIEKNSDLFDSKFFMAIIDTSVLLEKQWLKKERGTATKKLFLVAKIAEEINNSLDIETILTNTLERLMEATRSDTGLIMFIDEKEILYPIAYKGISAYMIEDLNKNPVKANIGSRGRALLLGKTVEARLNRNEIETSMTGSLLNREKLSTILTVPLKSKEDSLGIMVLGRRKDKNYSGKDMELLDAIGNHIVIAINNASLYEQIKFQLDELEEKNKKLKELEQIKEKLTRMIIHDLKSPLTGIMAYSEFFNKDKEIDKNELIRIFRSIYSSSQDILNMVMNLLDIGRLEEKKLEVNFTAIDAGDSINKVLNNMEMKLYKKNIKVIKIIPESLPVIRADKNLFYRIITNLMDNAIKYSPNNSKVAIEIKYKRQDNNITFCFIDEGKGIPAKYREKIFEAFFTIDVDDSVITTSTGIGLSFCKLAIEAHGGKIWVEDNIPRGSEFFFTLPL